MSFTGHNSTIEACLGHDCRTPRSKVDHPMLARIWPPHLIPISYRFQTSHRLRLGSNTYDAQVPGWNNKIKVVRNITKPTAYVICMFLSPGSKKTIAFRQANSASSTWVSRSGLTTSSSTLLATRLISTVLQSLGITHSLPSSSISGMGSDRRATPNNRCSPAWALSSATYKLNQTL